MNMTLLIPKGDTLVTYYILPLVGVNKATFSRSFVTSYISKDGTQVFVELKHPMTSPTYKYSLSFQTDVIIEDINFVVFKVDPDYASDVNLFLEGSYSKMSKGTKMLICNASGLSYNASMDLFTMTDPILQALGKTKRLRTFLCERLNVEELADSDELIEKPSRTWFIEYRINMLKLKLKVK